ncbi:4-hydroxyproline epimerase [Acinetobacter boissieri]|uniref:4-hydroxyproline epimerase n=1 Tax=Acinetobacter boissieri TaxID=1219383 RepID=A0A1G6H0R1_9GAMM|nr:4-hydroxyproline epimerase [Acinetobacter boissieri]SDB87515.1 4-hydroxyproline epimerase [Acinetobacter boissieri]
MQKISIIDSHTGGEPTRLIIDGFPDLGLCTMQDRLKCLSTQHDHYRKAVMLEPRGHNVLVGAVLCEPVDPTASAGVIFFNNMGYLGMCGHGTIGLIHSLAYIGKIKVGTHKIETPVGDITATLHDDGSVSIKNVISWRYKKDVIVDSKKYGEVKGDIAWGGNWFFLVNDHGLVIDKKNIPELSTFSLDLQKELQAQNIFGEHGAIIDHIELFTTDTDANSRSFVLCPGGEYDRSPCGTGTSAKLACLAADKKLEPYEIWRQASIIGSQFEAYYEPLDVGIQPIIRGSAAISAETTLILEDNDVFIWGI